MTDHSENRPNHWYIQLILGIIFIVLGIWAYSTPIAVFLTIIIFFSISLIFSGIVEIIYSLYSRKHLKRWGWYTAGGATTFLIGIILAGRPDVTALLVSVFIGFWMLFRSVMYTVSAFEFRGLGSSNWGWTLVLGLLGIIFSLVMLVNPLLLGVGVGIWIGFGLITMGIINIILSFTLRKEKSRRPNLTISKKWNK